MSPPESTITGGRVSVPRGQIVKGWAIKKAVRSPTSRKTVAIPGIISPSTRQQTRIYSWRELGRAVQGSCTLNRVQAEFDAMMALVYRTRRAM